MIEGSCLCGKVSFILNDAITEIARCHCSQCRQAQGGAFATNCPVDNSKLNFTGIEHITEIPVTGDKVRAFCKHCGSPMYSARSSTPDVKRLRMGTITTDFECDNQYHIYTASRPSWDMITDSYPQYDEEKLD